VGALILLSVLGIGVAGTAAIFRGRVSSILVSVFWALGLAFFVAPPVFSLAIARPADRGILTVFSVISLLVSQRGTRTRRSRKRSDLTWKYESELHLTPNGWVRGSEWFEEVLQAEVAHPEHLVLTMMKQEYMRADAAHPDIEWTQRWRSPSITDSELAALRQKFPLSAGPDTL
jgi:K+-sensing histidine kinase KdpD